MFKLFSFSKKKSVAKTNLSLSHSHKSFSDVYRKFTVEGTVGFAILSSNK